MAKKPGKYDAVMRTLPKTTGIEPHYQTRVDVQKAELRKCKLCGGQSTQPNIACGQCNNTGRRAITPELLATIYATKRAELEIAQSVISGINCEIEALTQLLTESQERHEPGWGAFGAADNAVKLTSGDALRLQPEIYPTVKDKKAFRNWLILQTVANEETDAFKAARIASFDTNPTTTAITLPPKVFTDLIKDRLLEGLPEPDGITVFVKTKVVFTEFKPDALSNEVETFRDIGTTRANDDVF